MKNLFKWITVLNAIALVLISCAPASTPILTATITPSKTPLPSATPTLTPSPTPSLTPTPSAEQIAEMLGLPMEVKLNDNFSYFHKYRIDGDNLMDDYNNTIAGQKKNGVWEVVTDPTIKYGALADSLGMKVVNNMDATGGYMARPNDARYKQMDMNLVFTGEWEAVDWVYPKTGQTIKDYRALMVYPDGDGTVKKLLVSVFSPDMPGKSEFRWIEGSRTWLEPLEWLEALRKYLPGQKWKVNFVREGPDLQLISGGCYPNGICGEEYNRLMYLQYEQKEKLKLFADSWKDENLNSSSVPDGLVIPRNYIMIREYNK